MMWQKTATVVLWSALHVHMAGSLHLNNHGGPRQFARVFQVRQSYSDRAGPLAATENNSQLETKSRAAEQAEGLVIVGAGIAGLATAAALRSIAGVSDIRIVEKCDEASFRDDRSGAGAQLGPNGQRALRAIGGADLVDRTVSSGTKLVGNVVELPPGAAPSSPGGPMKIPDSAEADTGLPQVLMRWGVLRSLLSDLVPDDSISCGTGESITGYKSTNDGGVQLVASSGDSVGPKSAPLIVAADGIYSTFRSLVRSGGTELSGGTSERRRGVKYNERINIKAAIESELGDDFDPGHTYSFFTPGGGVACFAGPAGDGYTYWAISIADKSSEHQGSGGDEEKSDDKVIRLASDPNVVDSTKLKDALLEKLRNLDNPQCQFAIDKIKETDPKYIFVSPSEEAEEIGPDLVSSDGRIVLVGDAAHAMSPSYGQGANFALEDAASLAVCVRDSDDLMTAVKTYDASRIERCVEMQHRSAERAAKAMRGEQAEDVSKWIFQWDISEEGNVVGKGLGKARVRKD